MFETITARHGAGSLRRFATVAASAIADVVVLAVSSPSRCSR